MQAGSRAYWLAVAAYGVGLLGLQAFMGLGVDAFKERWGVAAFETVMMGAAAVVAAAVAALGWKLWRRALPGERGLMLLCLVLYGLGLAWNPIPQERLHYVEYGLLAGLIYTGRSAEPDRRGWWRSAVLAVAVTSAIGLLDEILQGSLWPRRYFDWRDVALNLRAAALGVLFTVPAARAWRRLAAD